MKNDVLFGIVLTILNEGKCTASYLSKKFEVSPKTISRYLIYLEMSGVPTMSTFGRNGGTEIVGSFSIDNLFFTKEELSRIFLHIKSSPFSNVDKIDTQIEDKLKYELKISKSNIATNPIYIDNKCWNGETTSIENLKTILVAIKNKLNLDLNYTSTTSGFSKRTITPLLIINKECKWYCLAYCDKAQALRLFKISRIEKISLSDTPYIDRNISQEMALKYITNTFDKTSIVIESAESELTDIREWLSIKKTEKLNNGNMKIEGTAINNNGLLYKLISYGDKITILSPQYIKERLLTTCKTIEQKYSIN